MKQFLALLSLMLLVLVPCGPALAAKTDIVVLKNGDKMTGEIKSLLRGKLEFSTDSMGTVYIDWQDIGTVISDTGQSLELANGQRFFGPLAQSGSEEMVAIETAQGQVGLSLDDVIAMYPVEAGFWDRLDVRASLGLSWDKASSVGKYSVGLEAEYRQPKAMTRANLAAEITSQENASDTRRANASINHIRFNRQKRFVSYFGNVESNDQLGIDLRALAGVGYGWVPIRSNSNWFLLTAGLDVNHEIPSGGSAETNVEAVGRVSYEYFRYSNPERSVSVNLTVFPSLTDFGRWRADFDTDFRLEFVNDLFWVFSVFANFDSDPIDPEASNSDYGVNSSLSYKF
ncbi:MAG: DUF481 domain-containing protein [Xanthomonadales bacterium]|nr:DUF481 domain-containing protein [Gammaproteobacteria bacterium]MBT8050658.1 DUF481 domain-containing protein [Gammaproteobacteria bacterium]MBT8056383.1 DUF481 domain-containing protein [Gammaproteobacteria bacterium]NNJ79298.1 DUF481 domain-containing protein [Xanthomonadales bacterium]NNL04249.1 DUF481 domain-containing protein [Xanthomonadales bacterium]